jgi:hypothetical protein
VLGLLPRGLGRLHARIVGRALRLGPA